MNKVMPTAFAVTVLAIAAAVFSQGPLLAAPPSVLNRLNRLEQIERARIGTIRAYAGEKLPQGWLHCDGSALDKGTHPALFKVIGEAWGDGGDGSGGTKFSLPDLRGAFLRGLDRGRGWDKNRKLGSQQGDSLKSHTHGAHVNEAKATHAHSFPFSRGGGDKGPMPRHHAENCRDETGFHGGTNTADAKHSHSVSVRAAGGSETRPRNYAVTYLIYAGTP